MSNHHRSRHVGSSRGGGAPVLPPVPRRHGAGVRAAPRPQLGGPSGFHGYMRLRSPSSLPSPFQPWRTQSPDVDWSSREPSPEPPGKRSAPSSSSSSSSSSWTSSLWRSCGLSDEYVVVLGLLAVWYGACVVGTTVNKLLMQEFPYAMTLSVIHFGIAALVDYVWAVQRGIPLPLSRKLALWSAPVACALILTKVMTYVSYSYVPASLTHTAKASSPIFSVVVTYVMVRKLPGLWVGLSLLPVVFGVALAALHDIDFNMLGFLAAVLATGSGVLQTTFTKMSLTAVRIEPLAFHMWTSLAATLCVTPVALLRELPGLRDIPHEDLSGDGDVRELGDFPWALVAVSVGSSYAQNIASIYFLQRVQVLTYIVANTFKRMVVIVGTVVYFHNHITPLNATGMCVALCGFFLYGVAKGAASSSSSSSSSSPSKGAAHRNGAARREYVEKYSKTPAGYDDDDDDGGGGGILMVSSKRRHGLALPSDDAGDDGDDDDDDDGGGGHHLV